jgi:hypothetical protein
MDVFPLWASDWLLWLPSISGCCWCCYLTFRDLAILLLLSIPSFNYPESAASQSAVFSLLPLLP